MILLIDTSTPLCKLTIIDDDIVHEHEWQADRTLAHKLLRYIKDMISEHNWTWQDITALAIFTGPGSFTGLRIGITVFNTLADTLQVPLVGTNGIDWQSVARTRLDRSENDHMVMPFYGSEAHITTPRK